MTDHGINVGSDDAVWATTDKAVIKEYLQVSDRCNAIITLAVQECHDGYNREPLIMDYHDHFAVTGLDLRERDFDWATDPRRTKFGGVPGDEPPPGFRKRVKDDYFTPIPKGGDLDAQIARELFSRYSRIENVRLWLKETHQGPASHFFASRHGMHFGSPGFHVSRRRGMPRTLWVWCGPNYEIKGDAFEAKKVSEFLEVLGR